MNTTARRRGTVIGFGIGVLMTAACAGKGTPGGIDSLAVAALMALDQPDTHDAILDVSAIRRDAFLVRSAIDFSTTSLRRLEWREGAWVDRGPPWPDLDGSVAGGSRTPNGGLLFGWTTKDSPLGAPWDLWVSSAEGDGWTRPRQLTALNSPAMDCCLTATEPAWLYFSSNRAGSWDIYRSPLLGDSVGSPEPLGDSVNTVADEWPSYADRGGRFLLYSSIRRSGAGMDDIYLSCRSGDRWVAGRMLGPEVNTARYEDSAVLSPDGRWLLFQSHGGPGGAPGAIRIVAASVVRSCGDGRSIGDRSPQ
jgi:hypothetical protein